MFGNGLLEFELNLYMMEEPVTKSIWSTEAYIAQYLQYQSRAKLHPSKMLNIRKTFTHK